jgi:hypothetical protein
MTLHERMTEAIRAKLQYFNTKAHGSFAAYMAKAALEALKDTRYAADEQVTVSRPLLVHALAAPTYVLSAPDEARWILMEAPRTPTYGTVTTAEIKALRYAAAVNE